MAKRDSTDYNNRSKKFANALDEIISDENKIYYLRLIKYFENCLEEGEGLNINIEYEKVIKKLRFSKKISDSAIALIFGITHTTVGRWHTFAKPTIPPIDTVVTLAEIFEVTTDYLLGLAGTPNVKTEEKNKVFNQYGIDAQGFVALDAYYTESNAQPYNENAVLDYDRAVLGLNFLLKQKDKNVRMDILTRIGYFLTQTKFDNYYYFDSDDVDDLFDDLFHSITAEKNFNSDFVKESLNSFLSNSPQFSISGSVLKQLDTIRDKLKAYKEEINPGFFDSLTDDRQFFKLKLESDDKAHNKKQERNIKQGETSPE